MINATEPTATHPLDSRVPPPIVALIVGFLMWGGAHAGPTFTLATATRVSVSVVFALAAAVFGFSAFGAFRRANTTIDPINIDRASALVTRGVFSVTRNPMYVALTALLTSWGIYLASWVVFLGPVAFVLYITRFQIVPEERVMRSKFGTAYQEYSAHTRRWL